MGIFLFHGLLLSGCRLTRHPSLPLTVPDRDCKEKQETFCFHLFRLRIRGILQHSLFQGGYTEKEWMHTGIRKGEHHD